MLFRDGPASAAWATSRSPLRVSERISVSIAGVERSYPAPLAVECRVGGQPFTELALLDTGADRTLIGDELGQILRDEDVLGESLGNVRYSTRFGTIDCDLHNLPVAFVADPEVGHDITVNATCAVAPHGEWSGPTVIGFFGALECLRFAIEVQHTADAFSWLYLGHAYAL